MSEVPDNILVERIKQDQCSQATLELVERHKGLIVDMAKRYSKGNPASGCALQDFIDDAPLVIYKAAESFEEDKNVKFSTWVGNVARFHCLNTNNKDNKYHFPLIQNDEASDRCDENELRLAKLLENHEYIMDILGQLKDTRIKQIIQRRYFSENREGRKFRVIANKLGLTTACVQTLHSDFLNFMKSKIKSENSLDLV